ncbi:MAG: DUF3060 domain-containing protein [Mycobacterium sp.]|nr:DUF3060 domain-containing protein [Mycobacterium sp.]
MRRYSSVAIGLVLLSAGCASAEEGPAGDLITYGSMGARTQIDCENGKTLDVSGSNNTLTVVGRCASVSVGGADNTITVAQVDDQLTVDGINNTITYRAGEPKITDAGKGNRISRG